MDRLKPESVDTPQKCIEDLLGSVRDPSSDEISKGSSLSEGTKFDGEKSIRPELVPPEALVSLGTVLAFGAKKYEDRNWEKGMSWGRVYGALQRHLNAWWSGEQTDPETGYSHLWHANCCLNFLVAYEARGIGKDDRP